MCTQAILGKYLGECQAIKDAVAAARDANTEAEDRYANARTQQQAEAAEADIKSSTEALAQVLVPLNQVCILGSDWTLQLISSSHQHQDNLQKRT